MKTKDNRYERKAPYNPDRQSYVDEDGNYVYLIWDNEIRAYRKEICAVGKDNFTPELRAALDEMDAEEERYQDTYFRHQDKVFEDKRKAFDNDTSESKTNPMDLLPQARQRTFDDALRENPQIAQVLRIMDKLSSDQIDLIYSICGEMKFGADVAREQGVYRQAINNRLKKIHTRLAKLMAEIDAD